MCGETTHGEIKHTLSCSVVTCTAYIYVVPCSFKKWEERKKARRQKKMKRGNNKRMERK